MGHGKQHQALALGTEQEARIRSSKSRRVSWSRLEMYEYICIYIYTCTYIYTDIYIYIYIHSHQYCELCLFVCNMTSMACIDILTSRFTVIFIYMVAIRELNNEFYN